MFYYISAYLPDAKQSEFMEFSIKIQFEKKMYMSLLSKNCGPMTINKRDSTLEEH